MSLHPQRLVQDTPPKDAETLQDLATGSAGSRYPQTVGVTGVGGDTVSRVAPEGAGVGDTLQ